MEEKIETTPMVVDFHTHVLPSMDDGSRSVEMSLEMLRRMKTSGIAAAVATPHYYRKNEDISTFLERRERSEQSLRMAMDAEAPKVYCGAEVAFYFGMETDYELEKLCIRGTRTLLLELPFASWTEYEWNVLSALCFDQKLTVVLAHYERFYQLQRNNRLWERILELPVYVQMNGDAVCSFLSRRQWLDRIQRGQIQLLGSDCHNLERRPPNLGQARDRIAKKLGAKTLDAIDRWGTRLLKEEEYIK